MSLADEVCSVCGVIERVDCVKNAVHAAADAAQYKRELEFLFPPEGPSRCNSACYADSTCAIIKPHAIVDGLSVSTTHAILSTFVCFGERTFDNVNETVTSRQKHGTTVVQHNSTHTQ